jgi:hypothetical protein
MKKDYTILMFGLLLSSCATSFDPAFYYDEIIVHNKSGEPIHNLTLSASGSDRSLNCAEIAPEAICRDKFPRRQFLRNPLQVTWESGDAPAQSETSILETPATLSFGSAYPMRAIIEITAEGSIVTYFEQDIY